MGKKKWSAYWSTSDILLKKGNISRRKVANCDITSRLEAIHRARLPVIPNCKQLWFSFRNKSKSPGYELRDAIVAIKYQRCYYNVDRVQEMARFVFLLDITYFCWISNLEAPISGGVYIKKKHSTVMYNYVSTAEPVHSLRARSQTLRAAKYTLWEFLVLHNVGTDGWESSYKKISRSVSTCNFALPRSIETSGARWPRLESAEIARYALSTRPRRVKQYTNPP